MGQGGQGKSVMSNDDSYVCIPRFSEGRRLVFAFSSVLFNINFPLRSCFGVFFALGWSKRTRCSQLSRVAAEQTAATFLKMRCFLPHLPFSSSLLPWIPSSLLTQAYQRNGERYSRTRPTNH